MRLEKQKVIDTIGGLIIIHTFKIYTFIKYYVIIME
jgi:hypothetical protein